MTATAARFNKNGTMDIFNTKKQKWEHKFPKKTLRFEVTFPYDLESERLVRHLVGCLNTPMSKVTELKESTNA